jgi:DNA-binding transcriptional ArsR family regulator
MNSNYLRSIPREWRTISRAFTALGDEHRQRMLLTFERGERLTVGQIAHVSTLSRPTVSHHLKLLREAGVLSSEKVGKEVFYWIDKPFLEDSLEAVLDYIRERA